MRFPGTSPAIREGWKDTSGRWSMAAYLDPSVVDVSETRPPMGRFAAEGSPIEFVGQENSRQPDGSALWARSHGRPLPSGPVIDPDVPLLSPDDIDERARRVAAFRRWQTADKRPKRPRVTIRYT